jgi:hypothetical protein
MARQERTATRTRKAAEQADAIIADATSRAQRTLSQAAGFVPKLKKCPVCATTGTLAELKAAGHGKGCMVNAPQVDAKPRAKVTAGARVVTTAADPQRASQAERAHTMRNAGQSWMAIGAALGLPGAKSGAAAARKLYAEFYGSHKAAPGVQRRGKERHEATVGAKRDRREQVQFGTGLIKPDMPDDEVLALLRGKTVEWAIDLRRLADGKGEPEWCEQDAKVHPTDAIIEQVGPNGDRCIRFRTLEGWTEQDKQGNSEPISGPTRTVRLAAIHTVR